MRFRYIAWERYLQLLPNSDTGTPKAYTAAVYSSMFPIHKPPLLFAGQRTRHRGCDHHQQREAGAISRGPQALNQFTPCLRTSPKPSSRPLRQGHVQRGNKFGYFSKTAVHGRGGGNKHFFKKTVCWGKLGVSPLDCCCVRLPHGARLSAAGTTASPAPAGGGF